MCTKLPVAFTSCVDGVAQITSQYLASPAWSPSREILEWSVKKMFVSSRKYYVVIYFLTNTVNFMTNNASCSGLANLLTI